MIGVDEHNYSQYALVWLLNNMVDDGDEVICVRVLESPVRPDKNYQDDARKLLETIKSKNELNKAISVILEYSVGKLHDTFQQLVRGLTTPTDLEKESWLTVDDPAGDLQSFYAHRRHQGTDPGRVPGAHERAKLVFQVLSPIQPHPGGRGSAGRQATQEEGEALAGSRTTELRRHARLQLGAPRSR